MSAPFDSSGSQSPDLNRDNLLSPTSASHPLPPRPSSNLAVETTSDTQQKSADATPTLPQQPRIRGGFEVEDDDEEEQDQEEDEQDDADVYDPAAGLDDEATPPALDQTPIDRQSQSPIQRNGITPVSAQPLDSPAGASSSHLQSGFSLPTADAESSAQAVADIRAPISPTPLPSTVNGLSSAAVAKSSRLAHDTIGILEDRIKEDPRGDPDAYFDLIQEYKNRNKQDDVRATYERYLAVFPSDAAEWCAYLKWEEAHDQKSRMEQIFNKILPKLLNIDLWMIYINHVRRIISSNRDETTRQKTIDSVFTFSLTHIGIDKDAGSVWQEYIAFLKTGPGTLGGTSWQDGAKADSIRAAYQKAIAVPTEAVTQLWRDYDTFENSLSKINGRKHLQEMSASYMTARQAYHQLSNSTAGLSRTTQPRLPPRPGFQGDDEWSHQLDLWYSWIEFEKDDPLILKDDDRETYLKRVTYVYKQALMALQFWPGMWYSAAEFCFESGMEKEALAFLEDGIAANPESPLLAFKLADRIESTTQNDETSDPGAQERMKKVRKPYDGLVDTLHTLITATTQREREDIQRLEAESQNATGDDFEDEVNAANVLSKKASLDAQIAVVKAAAAEELDLLTKLNSHAWIAIARATRRIQGQGTPSSGFRGVFNEARKRGRLTSHFYVEYGSMEWQCYDETIGSKILERGMKLYPEDEYLPLHYVKYLFDKKKDVTNARGVFETTVTRMTAAGHLERTRSLFQLMHDYESRFGELSQVQKLENRMRELFPDETRIGLFSDRFATPPFDPIVRFPVVSKSQIRPKIQGILPSIESVDNGRSPVQRHIDSIAVNSPKRPLPDDFDDSPARKYARGESPLKGAAGRKMNQQRQTNAPAPAPSALPPPLPPPLPPQIHYLLSILPKSQYYTDARFDAAKMANILRDVHLPPPGQLPAQHTPQPPPGWPHQQPHPQPHHFAPSGHPPMPGQPYMQPPTPAQSQYGGAPFRFA